MAYDIHDTNIVHCAHMYVNVNRLLIYLVTLFMVI